MRTGAQRCAPAILLIFLTGLVFGSARHSAEAVKAFNAAVESFNAGDCTKAIPLLDQALSADGDFADAYYARGACRYKLQSTDGALMDLSDAIRLDGDLLDARALRGVLHYDAQRWDPALDDFNYVLTRRPTDGQALIGRGVIFLGREQKKEAEQDFRVFLKAHPSDPLAPKLRTLLTQLHSGGDDSGEEPAQPQEEAPKPRRRAVHHSPAAKAPDMKALADSLMARHALSEKVGQQVLQGNRGPVAGEIGHDTEGQ